MLTLSPTYIHCFIPAIFSHWGTLGSDVIFKPVNFGRFLITECVRRFWTSLLVMVPMDFWVNSDLFKKGHFSSSKTDKFRTFFAKSLKFSTENLSKAK